MLNEKQKLIVDWLENSLNLPVYSHAYQGAVYMLSNKYAGYLTFVSHAGRDFINGLARDAKGDSSAQTQYVQRLDEITECWKSEWNGINIDSENPGNSGHFITSKACQKVSELINDHVSGRLRAGENNTIFFITFLDYQDINLIPINQIEEWRKARDWFKGHAHIRRKPINENAHEQIYKHFSCLESFLYVAASSSFQRTKELNEILDQTNA